MVSTMLNRANRGENIVTMEKGDPRLSSDYGNITLKGELRGIATGLLWVSLSCVPVGILYLSPPPSQTVLPAEMSSQEKSTLQKECKELARNEDADKKEQKSLATAKAGQ